MKTSWMTLVGVVAALGAATAHAETFYDKDGIVFEGTIRQTLSDAAVCNVLEDHHTERVYQYLKANQGRPLHVWRMDVSVRNGSGRGLAFLQADIWILSDRPPCTNWDGPEAGVLEPFISVWWSDHYELMSMPYGMRAGQEERRSFYVLAIDGQRPRFGEWDVNYTFEAGSGAGRDPAGEGRRSTQRGSAPAGQLPPEFMADRHLRRAEQAVRSGDFAIVRLTMERLEALQQEHALEPTAEDHYRYAQAWEAAGEPERAMESAVRYLQLQGRDAEHYTEALDLMNRAESGRAGAAVAASRVEPGLPRAPRQSMAAPAIRPAPKRESRELPSGVSPPRTCAGKEPGVSCWIEVADRPECYVWNQKLKPEASVTWNGRCVEGLASGFGSQEWRWTNEEGEQSFSSSAGNMEAGKRHGNWTIRTDWSLQEGSYIGGRAHGDWTVRDYRTGAVIQSPVGVMGGDLKFHGDAKIRTADGAVHEGRLVESKRSGRWTIRFADGRVQEGMYVGGERHGPWTTRQVDGDVMERVYSNGEAQSNWRFATPPEPAPARAVASPGICTRKRLIELGELRHRTEHGLVGTIQFTDQYTVMEWHHNSQYTLSRQFHRQYKVAPQTVTFSPTHSVVKPRGRPPYTIDERGHRQHTESCRINGNTLHLGDQAWR